MLEKWERRKFKLIVEAACSDHLEGIDKRGHSGERSKKSYGLDTFYWLLYTKMLCL